MNNNFKYLIFDFDGTLADTAAIQLQAFNNIHAQFALPKLAKKELEVFRSSTMKSLISRYKIGPVKLLKITEAMNQEIASLIKQADFYPGIKKILLTLKKQHVLGILSSNHISNIEAFFINQQLPLASVFTFWRGEKQLFGKEQALKTLIKKYKIQRKQVLYFADQVRDIEACQKVGVAVAAVAWGFAKEELLVSAQPDFFLNHPSEILELLS